MTPVSALVGTLVILASLDVVLGPSLRLDGLHLVLGLGLVIGSILAAPVTLGVLPWLLSRQPSHPPASAAGLALWGAASGVVSSALLSLAVVGAAPTRLGALWLLIVFAGGVAGGVAGLSMPWLSRRLGA